LPFYVCNSVFKKSDFVNQQYETIAIDNNQEEHVFNSEDTYYKFDHGNPSSKEGDYATAGNGEDNRISGDYEIADEIPAMKIKDGVRDSH